MPAPEPLMMTLEQVLEATTLSTTSWYALVNAGDAPKPRQLSKGRAGWLRREIVEWCEGRPVSQCLPPVNAGKGRTAAARAAAAANAAAQEQPC